jgi:ABC-type multidrug transport system fused ATPase/permease subunit
MVLSAGKIIEFASPAELLETEKGAFRALVDESKDKDELWAMVKRPAAKCE